MPQHDVWNPAARASYWWCLKSIFQQLQSFWLSDKSAWQRMQAFFPGRMSSLSAACADPFSSSRQSYRTPWAAGRAGPAGPAPVTAVAAVAWSHSWPGDDQPCVQLGLGLEPRAELRLSKHVHPWISHSQPWRVTSCATRWICCSHVHRINLPFLSHKCIKLLLTARLNSHALVVHFSLVLSAAPRFPALAGLKAAPAQFWLPLPAVVGEQPQAPLPGSLDKPILIPFSVYKHPIPVINNISLCLLLMQIHLSLMWEANPIHNRPVMVSATPGVFSFLLFFLSPRSNPGFFHSHIRYWWFIVYLCNTQLFFFSMSFSAGDLYTSYIQQLLWEWLSTIRFHPTAITSNP